MGRPPTRPIRFRDGFYIEVRNKGASSGMKIRSNDEASMLAMAAEYSKIKDVIVLGEHKKDRWLNETPASREKAERKEARKEAKINSAKAAELTANNIKPDNNKPKPVEPKTVKVSRPEQKKTAKKPAKVAKKPAKKPKKVGKKKR